MARIAGVDLPKNKHLEIALTYIYGIGRTTSKKILDEAELSHTMNSDDLTDQDVTRIRKIIEEKYDIKKLNLRLIKIFQTLI